MRFCYGERWLKLGPSGSGEWLLLAVSSGQGEQSWGVEMRVRPVELEQFRDDLRVINQSQVHRARLDDTRTDHFLELAGNNLGRIRVFASFDEGKRPLGEPEPGFEADQTCLGPFLKQLNLYLEQRN